MDLDTLLGVLDVADRLYRGEGPDLRSARSDA
jgi:hypothetical protein